MQAATENISNMGEQALSGLKDNLNTAVSGFNSPTAASASNSGFLDSNTLIAKFGFLIIIIVLFVFALRIGIQLIGYFAEPSRDPWLVNGQISGDTAVIISQDPARSKNIIYRSNNQPTGMEFTWSVWLLYKGFPQSGNTKYAPIFVKGDASAPSQSEFYSVNNGPGLYFGNANTNNTLYVLMDTVNSASTTNVTERIEINNIPIHKYFHLAVRCQNKYVDVYINGSIVSRKNLVNVPKQNYYDVHVCENGGFQGNLSNLRYYSRALSVVELNSIVSAGPNLNAFAGAGNGDINGGIGYSYLSSLWYNAFLN